jgi:polyisoprenoid-binding protein YceI
MLMTLMAVSLLACDQASEKEDVVSTAPVPNEDQPPPPPADVDVPLPELPDGPTQSVQLAGSSIEFTGSKITGSHDGSFSKFSGKVVVKDDQVVATSFSIDLNSTTVDHPKLTKHLKSKDFFHVEKYGEAKFVSSAVKPAVNPGAVTHSVEGVMDFHGKSRPLSFPASITVGATETTVTATFDINRQNWGVSYPGKPDDLIKDDVQIRLNLTFPVEPPAGE